MWVDGVWTIQVFGSNYNPLSCFPVPPCTLPAGLQMISSCCFPLKFLAIPEWLWENFTRLILVCSPPFCFYFLSSHLHLFCCSSLPKRKAKQSNRSAGQSTNYLTKRHKKIAFQLHTLGQNAFFSSLCFLDLISPSRASFSPLTYRNLSRPFRNVASSLSVVHFWFAFFSWNLSWRIFYSWLKL